MSRSCLLCAARLAASRRFFPPCQPALRTVRASPRAVERIIQAQQELERQIAICADTRRDIITIINQITDARDQEILRRRYLLGQRFEQIAVEMHLEYRWVRRRHKQAIEMLLF